MNKINRVWILGKINVHLSALSSHVSLCMNAGFLCFTTPEIHF